MKIIKTTLRLSFLTIATALVAVGSAYAVVANVQWII